MKMTKPQNSKDRVVGGIFRGIVGIAALAATVGLAHARATGSKPATIKPVVANDVAVTSSIKKPEAIDPDITGSIGRPASRKPKVNR